MKAQPSLDHITIDLKVLFFSFMPNLNASSRFRLYNYAKDLRRSRIFVRILPPYANCFYHLFNSHESRSMVFFRLVLTLLNRMLQLWQVPKYDVVFIQRELFELFPNYLERLLLKLNPNIVYDFDDAVYEEFRRKKGGLMTRLVDFSKTKDNIKLSKRVIAGNEYLAEYARQFNSNVTVIPTPIDAEIFRPSNACNAKKITIGWIGTSGNLLYLDILKDSIYALKDKLDFSFKVVCNKKYKLSGFEVDNKKWCLEDEVTDLQSFDIGIMPLIDNAYTRGKCGFKILEYMSVGIPVVCSPVGVNCEIVVDGVNGFFADSSKEWAAKLAILIKDKNLRQRLGREARKTVGRNYSRQVLFPKFLNTLKAVARL